MGPWMIVIWVALMVVSYLLRPKPATPTSPDPGEAKATVVDAASPVPVLFGTRKLTSANCVWYGDVGTTPIISCGGGKK